MLPEEDGFTARVKGRTLDSDRSESKGSFAI